MPERRLRLAATGLADDGQTCRVIRMPERGHSGTTGYRPRSRLIDARRIVRHVHDYMRLLRLIASLRFLLCGFGRIVAHYERYQLRPFDHADANDQRI